VAPDLCIGALLSGSVTGRPKRHNPALCCDATRLHSGLNRAERTALEPFDIGEKRGILLLL